MTEKQKFDELAKNLGTNQVICKHVGVKNQEGAQVVPPLLDPDHDYEIPLIRVFYVSNNKKQRKERISDFVANGWMPFEPAKTPKTKRSRKSKTK